MKEKTRTICAMAAMAVTAAITKADGDYVVVNNPVFDYATFAYSDALSTKGVMEYGQSVSQSFTLDEGHDLTTLTWWGGMNNFFGVGDENLRGFEITVWNKYQTGIVLSTTVLSGDYTKTLLPEFNQFGGQVSKFFMPFTGAISAGTYHMNIGALYHETAPLEDQWLWSTGIASIDDPMSLSVTSNSIPGGWGEWFNGIPPYGTGILGGAFVMTAPAPGAFALLVLGGIVGGRRRR